MQEIQGDAKTVRQLLQGAKYHIDYYQREYKWEQKQVYELIDDLSARFLQDYDESHLREAVANYGHYFLGSIIISRKHKLDYIVDGQQRLTTLTLLLIYLYNMQRGLSQAVKIDELIFSEKFGKKTFNIDVAERTTCMEALFDAKSFDAIDKPESVRNLVDRYRDIEAYFPDDVSTPKTLPYFVDWLIENVHLVEITAYSDEDAYTIFETMNDRGLSLSPVDMLKGFLLANITDAGQKEAANVLWKGRIATLVDVAKETDADFFKAWLRSQYADSIRERKKDARPRDFDLIGSQFHRWVRDHRERIGLDASTDYMHFIDQDFDFYSRQYLRILDAGSRFIPGLEPITYNARLGFTSQYPVLLAPLETGDSPDAADEKMRLVAVYLDILLNRRIWNWHSIASSTMQYAMFILMRDIRRMPTSELRVHLHKRLTDDKETFASNARFSVHQQNREYVRLILARMTEYVETRSNIPSRYQEYTAASGKKRYEVEHIWANKPDRHKDEFPQADDFQEYRNRIGDLLLLPKSFNASYGALPYEDKLKHYNAQNLLARSLNPLCYDHNPGFVSFVETSGLPFKACPTFKKGELDQRQALYTQLAGQIWNPDLLLCPT